MMRRMVAWVRAWARRDPGSVLLVVALIATAALYASTLDRGLVNYDDTWLVGDNVILRDASWSTLHRIFFDTSSSTRFLLGAEYLPVRDVSVLLDLAIWGSWYPGHHLTNLVLYASAIVVWFAVFDTFGIDRKLVGLAILLWAVHPSHAESVAWISERKGLLGMLGAGVASLGYARFRIGGHSRWLALAMIATVLAVWSKAPSAFTIAALAGFELVMPAARRSWRRSVTGLAAIALVGLAAFLPVLLAATRLGVVASQDLAPIPAIPMALGIHGFYLELAVMIVPNAISYPISSLGPSTIQIVIGTIGLSVFLALVAVPARGRWRPPPILRAAAWLWLATWLPASRLVLPLKAVLIADRYALAPTMGVALAVAWLVVQVPSRRSRHALGAVVLLSASLRTLDAQSNWRDSRTLFERAVQSNPASGDAWSDYAEALEAAGAPELATEAVVKGLRHSRSPRLLFRKALQLLMHGQRAAAIDAMRAAADAGEPRAMSNLAFLLLEDGKADLALVWGRRAVEEAPMYGKAYRNLGAAALAAKHPQEAYDAFVRAYELWPYDVSNRYNVAASLVELRRFPEARVHLEACLDDPVTGPKARALLVQLPR